MIRKSRLHPALLYPLNPSQHAVHHRMSFSWGRRPPNPKGQGEPPGKHTSIYLLSWSFSALVNSIRFLWVASTVGKLILAKMWLFVHHPNLTTTEPATKDQVFITSIEVVEFGILLERGKDTAKWSWLFRTYMQWHAFAYVLSELATRAPGPEYDRAWNVVDAVHERTMLEKSTGKKEVIWKPLKTLWLKAKERREVVTGRKVSPVNLNIDITTDDWNNSLMESIGKSGHGSGGSGHGNGVSGNGNGGMVDGNGGMAPQVIDFSDPGFGLQTMFDAGNGFMPQMQQGLLWTPGLDDIVGTMQPWTGGQEEWH